MASHITSPELGAAPVARYGRAAQLVGSLALAAFAFAGGALFSPSAEAAKLCGDRDEILKRLEQRHDETPQALGLSSDGGVLEVLVSPSGGWTILVTYPKRPTCVVAVGEAWQALQLTSGEPA
jgi:hypothetical protein